MNASLISQIKKYPRLFAFSIGLHVLLLIILTISLSHTAAPRMPPAKNVDTVKAVVIDASVVEQEIQKLKQAENNERQQKIAQQKKLEREAKAALDKRRKEEKRLADLKQKEQQRKKELARKEKAEQEKKQKELALLKKQQQDLEKKNQAEKQRLAELEKKRVALEKKRKAEEAEALRKKQAAEAEARRKEQEVEMRQQMLAEERRMAKQSAENQRLLAQYIYQIQHQVEANWQAPVNMTAGWSCEVMVEQDRFGKVLNVQMKTCNGSEAFRSTVERAVRKASPLPEAPNNDIFEKRLNFIFRPDV